MASRINAIIITTTMSFALGFLLFFLTKNNHLSFLDLTNPLQDRVTFNYPNSVYGDKSGNYYLFDNTKDGKRRLMKIDSDGKLIYSVTGGERGVGKLNLFSFGAIDESGSIYLLNYSSNIDDNIVESIDIQIYDSNGNYISTPVRFEYDEIYRAKIDSEFIFSFMIPYINVIDNNLFFYYYEEPGKLVLYSKNLQSKELEKIISLKLSESLGDIRGYIPGNIYYVTGSGKFYRINEEGNSEEYLINNLNSLGNIFPYPIELDENYNIIFNDLFGQRIIMVKNNYAYEYYKFADLKFDDNDPRRLINYYNYLNGQILAVEKYRNNFIVVNPSTGAVKIISDAEICYTDRVLLFLQWVLLFLLLLCLINNLFFIYMIIFNGRIPLLLKNAIVFGMVLILSVYFISSYVYKTVAKTTDTEREKHYLSLAQTASSVIDGTLLYGLNAMSDIKSKDFLKLSEQMNQLVHNNSDKWNKDISIFVYKKIGDNFFVTDLSGYSFLYPYPVKSWYLDTYKDGKTRSKYYKDEQGDWLSAIAPLRDHNNKITGIVEISSNLAIRKEIERKVQTAVFKRIIFALVFFWTILTLLTYYMLKSVKKLRKFSWEVANKNYDVEIDIRSRDEIEDLGQSFNLMVKHIKKYDQENRQSSNKIEELKNANARFVPIEFLNNLGKKSIVDVKLGDQVKGSMTIMFNDIRNFSTLSEKMTPEENFRFLNSYLSIVCPVVRENRGFIDKYIGDCIMALYPESADDAIKASIGMIKILKLYNSQRASVGYEPINVGIGIHTGELMLGIIGETQRFEGTVISDSVNLASRLENLTKIYHIHIIASLNTILKSTIANQINYRFIDYLKVKGKSEPTLIYEIFDEDDPEQVILKNQTKCELEDAIHSLIKGNVEKSYEVFCNLKKINPLDGVIDVYLKRCDVFIRYGVPVEWEGLL